MTNRDCGVEPFAELKFLPLTGLCNSVLSLKRAAMAGAYLGFIVCSCSVLFSRV
jgi:hypothetical protein